MAYGINSAANTLAQSTQSPICRYRPSMKLTFARLAQRTNSRMILETLIRSRRHRNERLEGEGLGGVCGDVIWRATMHIEYRLMGIKWKQIPPIVRFRVAIREHHFDMVLQGIAEKQLITQKAKFRCSWPSIQEWPNCERFAEQLIYGWSWFVAICLACNNILMASSLQPLNCPAPLGFVSQHSHKQQATEIFPIFLTSLGPPLVSTKSLVNSAVWVSRNSVIYDWSTCLVVMSESPPIRYLRYRSWRELISMHAVHPHYVS